MLRFLDGPAAGVNLSCARAPLFLRVVQADGKWDALDQLNDRPEPGEDIHAYRKTEDQGTCHIDYTDRQGRRRGRWEQIATYRVIADQPDDATMRDNKLWRAWATAAHAKEKQRG